MAKSGSGDGVSQSGDPAEGSEGADPEVTAIARKLNDTGDTLGAIHALQQLIIERTGAIPVITVPQPASADDSAPADDPAARAVDAPDSPAGRVVGAADSPAGRVVGAADVSRPAEDDAEIDWSLPSPPHFDDEPGFSPWVDPDAIAAAQEDTPARSHSDVTTQVFAVFAAPEPQSEAGPEAQPARGPEPPEPPAPHPLPIPLALPTESLDVTPPPALEDTDDDDDVIDDTDHGALAGLVPVASVKLTEPPAPLPTPPGRGDGSPDVPGPATTEESQPKRRRFWFFGRR